MTPLCANLGARRLAILLASVIFVFSAIYASAELYEWVDEKGQRNFTDNPNNVPAKYRGKATVSAYKPRPRRFGAMPNGEGGNN
jgi:Domain of unknown function (DUF4124)